MVLWDNIIVQNTVHDIAKSFHAAYVRSSFINHNSIAIFAPW